MKRLAFFLLLCVVCLFSCEKPHQSSNALSAIPVNSAVVVRINNLAGFQADLENSIPGAVLQNSVLFAEVNEFISRLGAFNDDQTRDIQVFGGYHVSGAGRFDWLWCVEEAHVPFLTMQALKSKGNTTARNYAETQILHFNSEELDFYIAEVSGLILISTEENLVESGLKQLQTEIDLQTDAQFMHVLRTANTKDPINLFVQFSALPDWQETLWTEKPTWLADFAGWSALDLDINSEDLNLTGITLVPDSTATYLGLFTNTKNRSAQFETIIPENTALVIHQSCGDLTAWAAAFDKFLGVKNRLKKRNGLRDAIGLKPESWYKVFSGEMGVIFVDAALSADQSKQAYLHVNDAKTAFSLVQSWSGQSVETYRNHDIRRLKERNVLPLLFGKLFSNMPQPYWLMHNDWIIFSNDIEAAKNYINAMMAEKSWSNSASFNQAERLLESDAHIMVIARNPELLNLAQKTIKGQKINLKDEKSSLLNDINWVVMQFKQRNNAAYTELVLLHQTKQEVTAKQYWSTTLDEPAKSQPTLVRNHYSKANEVVLQDEANTLYLIDPKGKILWKKQLDGPILGRVKQIDMFRNNKLQLVFNTANKLYILDRNGQDVAPFPIQLPASATAPLGVFDYSGTRDYRLVVPCGKRMLNFGVDGRQVKGWKFAAVNANLTTEPKHEVLGSKDFIHLADEGGAVFVLNRRGEVRIPLRNKIPSLASPIYLRGKSQSEAQFFALSKTGYQINLSLTDIIDSIQPFGTKPKYVHQAGDKTLFGSTTELYLRSEDVNFDIELEDELSAPPALYKVGSTFYITATTGESVWVYDARGELLPGMPLYGTGTGTVGFTQGDALHLLVTAPDGVLVDYKLSLQ